MSKIPVGIQLYTVRELYKNDPVDTLKALAEIGYQGVEGGPAAGMSNADFLAVLKDCGLTLVGGGTGVGALRDDVEKVAADCRELGINTLMLGIAGELREHDNDWKKVVADLATACEKATAAGLRILYHNHAFEFETKVDGMYGLDYIFETIPAQHIQAEIDVYWVKTGGEDPVKYIERYAGRMPFLHIKDRTPPPGDEDNPFAEVGSGILDWDAIFDAAGKAGIEWYLVEQDRCNGNPLDSARQSFAFLKEKGLA